MESESIVDRTISTREEYEEALRVPMEIPRTSKRFFKGDNITRLDEIMRDPVMIDLEMLSFDGNLEDTEMLEYCVQLPEFRDVCRRSDAVVMDMFNFMKSSIPSRVRKSFKEDGTFQDCGLSELYDEVFLLSIAYSPKIAHARFRPNRIQAFILALCTLITTEIISEIQRLPHGHTARTKLVKDYYFNFLAQKKLKAQFRGSVPGLFVQNIANNIIVCNRKHSDSYKDLLGACQEESEDLEELENAAQAKFELFIDSYGQYNLQKYVHKIGQSRIEIYGINLPNPSSSMSFQCKVVLDPEDKKDYEFKFKSNGIEGDSAVLFDANSKYYDLAFDTTTGEIEIGQNIPLSKFIPKKDYLRLKNVLLDIVLMYLEELEINQDFKYVKAEPCPSKTAEEVGEIIAEVVPEVGTSGEDIQEMEEEIEDGKDLKEKRVPNKRGLSLSNKKGKRVLEVLNSLLGKPTNNGSSHYVFTGRNGNRYPISIHTGEDVGKGLLHCCLRHYGISREEFCAAY